MRISAALAMCCASAPVLAQDLPTDAFMDFLGAQGCTLGPESSAAAVEAGFTSDDIRLLALTAQAQGDAEAQGVYVVFDADVCTIRLPEITSTITAQTPEIQAAAPYTVDRFEYGGEVDIVEGCYLQDALGLISKISVGDEDAAFDAYLDFLGAGLISGDVRFFSNTPLATPRGFQLTRDECARAPNIETLTPSHDFIASGFGDYVRAVGASTICGERAGPYAMQISADIQGLGYTGADELPETLNAWLFFEYDLITLAAGWYDGMDARNRGLPRPPLCHYPQ